jgi:hypothetical protein
MTTFVIFAIVIYIPVLANMGMVPITDKITNITRLTLWGSQKKDFILVIVLSITDIVFPTTTEFIIIVCVIIMASKLREASKFRQSASTSLSKVYPKETMKIETDQSITTFNSSEDNKDKAASSTTEKLTGKDLRVVQQVVLISVVYIVCNIPKMVLTVFSAVVPEFKLNGRYRFLYVSAHGFRKYFDILNASINTFIYFKYNNNFRNKINQWRK